MVTQTVNPDDESDGRSDTGDAPHAQPAREHHTLSEGLRAVLGAADELVACPDMSSMLRRAVELARERLGIERCGLFLSDPQNNRLIGTFGTGFDGQTTDQRHITRPAQGWIAEFMSAREPDMPRWSIFSQTPIIGYENGQRVERGSGWVVNTPLVAQGRFIGVLFNDTAISNAPFDENRQELLAVYASFLANLIISRRASDNMSHMASRARCILFDAVLERRPEGYYKWSFNISDEAAAQRVLPLDVAPDESYVEAWSHSRHPDDERRMADALLEHAAIESGELSYQQEYRCLDRDGTWHWLLEEVMLEPLPPTTEGYGCWRAVGVCTDISARKRAEEELRHNAFYDVITGLANRALFMERLNRAFQRAKRHNHLFAVLFLDLDNFKRINDNLGHDTGDDLLIAVAGRLEACLRPGDTAARFGGDEFAVLLDGIRDSGDAIRVAERVQHELHQPFRLEKKRHGAAAEVEVIPTRHEVITAASIGVAFSRVPGEEHSAYEHPDELLRDADTAMYRAKSLGKGRHEVFDTIMHARALALLRTENDLRRALERGEFVLHYQAVWDVVGNKIVGFEALLRWKHATRGLLSPDEFMPVAEDHGWIVAIGEWALREACHQMRQWQIESGHEELFVCVNLSARQFAQPDLAQTVAAILADTGLTPKCLKLEISESVLMHSPGTGDVLRSLKEVGVHLSLDDFGTGYSSLLLLQLFPLDELKIDRSFISATVAPDNLVDGSTLPVENAVIVKTMVALSRALGTRTVAEGVESAAQWAELRDLGCDGAQGYFLERPLPAAEAFALLPHQTPQSEAVSQTEGVPETA